MNYEGGEIMSIWNKVSKTTKNTISTIGSKSSEMLEAGKLKLKVNQLEDGINIKKKEIGVLVYDAYAKEDEPDKNAIMVFVNDIRDLENELKEVKEKISSIHQKERSEEDNNH
jgi:hypothetical protein